LRSESRAGRRFLMVAARAAVQLPNLGSMLVVSRAASPNHPREALGLPLFPQGSPSFNRLSDAFIHHHSPDCFVPRYGAGDRRSRTTENSAKQSSLCTPALAWPRPPSAVYAPNLTRGGQIGPAGHPSSGRANRPCRLKFRVWSDWRTIHAPRSKKDKGPLGRSPLPRTTLICRHVRLRRGPCHGFL